MRKVAPTSTSNPGLARVQLEWGRRVEAEYRSAAITSELSLWLIRIGASPDLIEDSLRIVSDELVHARMSFEVFAAAGGTPEKAPMRHVDRATLGIVRAPGDRLELDVVRAGVQTFCLGETIAVPLFSHLRRGCTEAAPRAALDRILVDEVRHRDFGWDLIGWMLETDREAYAPLIEAELPGYFASLEQAYGQTNQSGTETTEITDEERTWGLAPAAEYAAILERTIARDYAPRFEELGFDATSAWERRPR